MALRSSLCLPISARCLSAELSLDDEEEEEEAEEEESEEKIAEGAEEEDEDEDRCLCRLPLNGSVGHVLFLVGALGLWASGTVKVCPFVTVSIRFCAALALNVSSSTLASSWLTPVMAEKSKG